jgi:hypothetical protein
MSTQEGQMPQGCVVGPSWQLSALAKILAFIYRINGRYGTGEGEV